MSSQRFQKTYENLSHVGAKFFNYLQGLNYEKFSQGEEGKTLESMAKEVSQGLNALEQQKYQIAVIAAMKAGKSTFLNALIGADVLASENESCTVCRTDVVPISAEMTPQLLEYREDQSQGLVVASGDSHQIRKRFLERTHLIRATGNRDRTVRFELQYPISAIAQLPALKGFTLVDTPGPNEWKEATFDTIALKETAFAALRNCDVILFILDYSSFKDDTNSELLQELIEQRSKFLQRSHRVVYFILNKIDRKAQEDRPIENVIEDLRRSLQGFGIPNPIIYPTSAWQGLLAKLIQNNLATDNNFKDFKRFFSGQYARETEDGDLIIPSPRKIAPQALEDSLIPVIEKAVLQDLVTHAGWDLLYDVTAKIDKSIRALEDIINARIQGWTMEIEPLREKMETYKGLAKNAIIQIRHVKKLVEQQEQQLVKKFRREIIEFSQQAKRTIKKEFDNFTNYHYAEMTSLPNPERNENNSNFIVPLYLKETLAGTIEDLRLNPSDPFEEVNNSNIIRCNSLQEVDKIKSDINYFCSILIKDWWTNTQDKLSREGTVLRQELVEKIQNYIQSISDELSQYLGDALEVSMNLNPIQILMFDFPGIDTQVQQQTENYTRWTRERKKAFCKDYEVDIQVDDHQSYYEIDLRLTIDAIIREIDAQTMGSLEVVERVIKKQISEDFGHAEKQINDYIHRFLVEFDHLLKERESREATVEPILADLDVQREMVLHYKEEITLIKDSLEEWRPNSK